MKFISIKTNNIKAINYLLENLKNLELDDVYLLCHKFKVFNNIIIYYKGTDTSFFLSSVSDILVDLVFDVFQKNIIEKILNHEYFYFDNIERKEILNKTENIVLKDTEIFLENRKLLFNIFYDFLLSNNKLYLSGFITFRLKEYINNLQKNLDESINQYLIEKEYLEFVSLLNMYVNSECSTIDVVHLIYNSSNPILLDTNKKIIKTDINLTNAKYLSDISFSSCDIVLNALLNMLPKRIYIHLTNVEDDEFINTLKLIFDSRVQICNDCDICRIYKKCSVEPKSVWHQK